MIFMVFDQVAVGEVEASHGTAHAGHAVIDVERPVVEWFGLGSLGLVVKFLFVKGRYGEVEEGVDEVDIETHLLVAESGPTGFGIVAAVLRDPIGGVAQFANGQGLLGYQSGRMAVDIALDIAAKPFGGGEGG